MGESNRTFRICRCCNKQTSTKNELTLDFHKAKKGKECPGSGLSVEGLEYAGLYPTFDVDPETGNALFTKEICEECEQLVAVETINQRVFPHLRNEEGVKCHASGHPYKSGQNKPTKLSRPIACPDCGQTVKFGRKRGRIYSHNLEGSTEVCSASGREIGGIEGAVVELPKIATRVKESKVKPLDPNYVGSVSIRAISAGLPGSKRR